MEIFNKTLELERFLAPFYQEKKTIGLVPTMGALHQGHLSLMKKALEENEVVVVSVFVNPTQFNNAEDLEKYPRNLERDAATIATLSDKIILFAPEVSQMYEGTPTSESYDFHGLDKVMEGSSRPGHFDGVATIVEKLFRLVRPTRAYFGEKDYQQILIIRSMVAQRKLNLTLVPCPIVREASGLAMSSRNERLSPQGKAQAAFIYQVLTEAKERFASHSVEEVTAFVKEQFDEKAEFELEYFIIADERTLQPATKKEAGVAYRAFIVAYIEGVRLIDNLAF